jgi:peptide deformylase
VRWRGLDGGEETLEVRNSYAAIVEHEIDHLNGVVYTDVSP